MAERAARRRSGAPTCSARGSSSSSFRSAATTRGRSSRRSCGTGPRAAARFTWPWEQRRGAASGADVLYVHGWSDYFFNPELAAVLVGGGRPLLRARPAQVRAQPAARADARLHHRTSPTTTPTSRRRSPRWGTGATDAAGARHPLGPLILLGHSTGGLTLSLWAARNPGRAAALVLNSPWLEFQLSGVGREALAPVDQLRRAGRPDGRRCRTSTSASTRARSSKELDGEWEYSHEWRPDRGFTVASGLAHRRSSRATRRSRRASTSARRCSRCCRRGRRSSRGGIDAMLSSDIVLVVDDIAERVAAARAERHGRAHRRGAARRVPVARARAGRGLRVDHALAARVRSPSALTRTERADAASGCRGATPAAANGPRSAAHCSSMIVFASTMSRPMRSSASSKRARAPRCPRPRRRGRRASRRRRCRARRAPRRSAAARSPSRGSCTRRTRARPRPRRAPVSSSASRRIAVSGSSSSSRPAAVSMSMPSGCSLT